MKREDFIGKLGIGLLAICAGDCIAACGKAGTGTPAPPPPPSNVNFTIDLNNELKAVGESKVSGGVIVARIASANIPSAFTAVQVACTHEQFSINYVHNQSKFICPLHNSEFSVNGVVLGGLAKTNLKVYACAIAGSTLTVTG